ncbi:hypothetical protein TVAG_398440 [Trichomonas vaginalis G3]|uniref:Uncharacterized protein n=1 Tax=Trichomonas vaginalis (strain ATCC PRA-98 / G3) TaxID=412133 RepID=A2FSV2_TRIV3|nr:hypothetical protein TVAGG3_0460860 [Trichomonas vaginalis G3]EAX92003.1 hypothetical protein TVAG_398440 [Trichomonas vaginalis G3]KAI5514408.1 hypothetical protein TVAGG3_0460860 [Trichomonas vaginalis G3]|eukprot:XP_001304933.1 hypothetical protein [Trichomonas vaginalis G3]
MESSSNSSPRVSTSKKTAKYHIKMRNYFEEKTRERKYFSNPFLCDISSDNEDFALETVLPSNQGLNIKIKKSELQKENKPADEILNKQVNLDDANHVISALKMPKDYKNTAKKLNKAKKQLKELKRSQSLFDKITIGESNQILNEIFQDTEEPHEEEEEDFLI